MRELGRLLMIAGGLLAVVGVFLSIGGTLPWKLGRLPGDILIKRDHFTAYVPITSSILVSLVLSLVVWLVRRKL